MARKTPFLPKALLLVCAFASPLSAQVQINEIFATASGRVLRWDERGQPYAGAGRPWWSSGFNDAAWRTGNTPIGYGINPISTNLTSDLNNISPSLYVRKAFNASATDAASTGSLILQINYNDGFIAWVNSIEGGRRNMGPAKHPIFVDQVAYRAGTTATTTENVNLGPASNFLVPGSNVLAIQIANNSLGGNLRLDMRLWIDNPTGTDPELVPLGSSVRFLPGRIEPTEDVYEPAVANASIEPGEPSDWIELYNAGASAVDLTNWSLSDDAANPGKWRLPAGTTLNPGAYRVVLADDPATPITGATYLHASFKLSADGEFLGLFDQNGVVQSQFSPKFPKQHLFHSYGRSPVGGALVHFGLPTPGAANSGPELTGKVDAPDFDIKGGFYPSAVTVTLTSQTVGANIRYTTDGTDPTLTNGLAYTTPLNLGFITNKKGHVIRARAFLTGRIPSNVKTNSYLINQDSRLRSAPALIYAGDAGRSFYAPFGALAIQGGQYVSSQWQPVNATDYNNVINRGPAYERTIHAEYYFANGDVGFRSDCGLRAAASSYSRPRMVLGQLSSSPWPASPVEKSSFNLYFRDEYGNPSVTLPFNGENAPVRTFEQFRIRAGKNDIRNPFVIDELARRLSTDMGQVATNGVINTLYVNGELKGFYNMVERLREPFFRAHHSIDPNAQWDILQYEGNDNVAEGDKTSFNDMISRLNAPVTQTNWERVLEVTDPVNMADYYLLNIFCATWDWPHNNWVAAKEATPAGRYRLYVWDAEGAMNNKGDRPASVNMIDSFIESGSGELRDLWRGLNRWEEFRLLFADRIQKHLFNGGVLDDRDYDNSRIKQRMDQLVTEFAPLLSFMNGETVTQSHPRNWSNATSGRRNWLFGPNREEFRSNDLWPTVTPPDFSQFGGSVANAYPLKITNEAGQIYYTTDGSDPRLPGGNPNPGATSQSGSTLDVALIQAASGYENGGTFQSGDRWSYSDADGDLGTAWRASSFNDSAWLSGPSPLGFGGITDSTLLANVPISTTVNPTAGAGTPRQLTVYFRRTFQIDDASAFLSLRLGIRSDGGGAVYINGVEAFRDSNLPANATYNTESTNDASDSNEGDLDEYDLNPALLVNGTNVIAVEMHNGGIGSSDMIMDLALDGVRTNPNSPPLIISKPVTVRARSYSNGTWSALTEADFTVQTVPAATANLAIAEMLYNPAGASASEVQAGFTDGDQFEYLRLRNLGSTAIDLHGVAFVNGISFDFNTAAIRALAPGGVALIVSDLAAFRARFGNGYDSIIAGQYGGRLNNGGERLRLIGIGGAVIHDFSYSPSAPWPVLGGALDGHSIVIVDPTTAASHGDGSNWTASASVGGNPGGSLTFDTWRSAQFSAEELADPSVSGPDVDLDGDGLTTFAEFALGTPLRSAANGTMLPAGSLEQIGAAYYLTLEFTRPAENRTVTYTVQVGADLSAWSPTTILVGPETTNPDGSVTAKYRDTVALDLLNPQPRFIRLHMAE